MPRVVLHGELVINPTGYSRTPVVLAPGRHEVSDHIANYVRDNPSVGSVESGPALAGEESESHEYSGDLARLSKADLASMAEGMGLEVGPKMTKAELIELLNVPTESG